MDPQNADPKGLIRESYRIDGITEAECRSILVDWALSLPAEIPQRQAIAALLERHATDAADHPMTALLRSGLTTAEAPKARRGGRAARLAAEGDTTDRF